MSVISLDPCPPLEQKSERAGWWFRGARIDVQRVRVELVVPDLEELLPVL